MSVEFGKHIPSESRRKQQTPLKNLAPSLKTDSLLSNQSEQDISRRNDERSGTLGDWRADDAMEDEDQRWGGRHDAEDIQLLQLYGDLTPENLLGEVQMLYDYACQLSLEEANVLAHGAYLDVLAVGNNNNNL